MNGTWEYLPGTPPSCWGSSSSIAENCWLDEEPAAAEDPLSVDRFAPLRAGLAMLEERSRPARFFL